MTRFVKSGSAYYVSNHTDVMNKLPPSVFVLSQSPDGVLYLEETTSLKIENELYGDVNFRVDRVLNTFADRTNTGVLLSGSKGSGKTLFAKVLSRKMQELGHPTILINQPYKGDAFTNLLKSIEQPCVVFFDEFEKMFDHRAQQSLLTVFDGVYASQRLYVVTTNNLNRVDDFMINRPGRFYYHFEYAGLDKEFITEYCKKNLNNTDYTDDLLKVSVAFDDFNFDILKAIVEEVNRYDEPPKTSLKYLNVTPNEESRFKVVNYKIKSPALLKIAHKLGCEDEYINPFDDFFMIGYDDEDNYVARVLLTPNHITKLEQNTIVFENDDALVTFEKVAKKPFSFVDLLV